MTHDDSSDYGYYGKTGEFQLKGEITVDNCRCGERPKISCNYSDIVGHRDTFYRLFCSCRYAVKGAGSVDLDAAVINWGKALKELKSVKNNSRANPTR